MNYTLYISDHCPTCKTTIAYLNGQNLDFSVVNVNETNFKKDYIIAVPALFLGEKLLAYGPDIRNVILADRYESKIG